MQSLAAVCLVDERMAVLMHQNTQTSNDPETCVWNTLHKITFANLE